MSSELLSQDYKFKDALENSLDMWSSKLRRALVFGEWAKEREGDIYLYPWNTPSLL